MVTMGLAVLLALSLLALLYTYALYPMVLSLATRLASGPERNAGFGEKPDVTLVIAAYNEEEVIAEKIRNSLELNYPSEKLDIVVFSDASSDRTDEIVRSFADEGVELQRIEGRVGKTECQNQVVRTLDSDVVVFSDANSMYSPDAITRLVEGFEPNVGCVVGELRYAESDGVEGEKFYWRFERALKKLESKFHSLVTANGAIYAVRRESYVELSPDAISDFAEPLAINQNGERVAYAEDAITHEHTGGEVKSELSRRVRIVTRSWHTLADYSSVLNPIRYPRFSFQMWSHKVLRWLSPVLLAAAFVTTLGAVLTSSKSVFTLLFVGQLACYLCAGIGAVLDRYGTVPTLFHIPYYFLVSNYGLAVGLWNFINGQNIVTWQTETRQTD